MDTRLLTIIIVAAVAVALAAWWYVQTERRQRLRKRFGPEYERAVRESGSPARAEAELEARTRRIEKLHIRALTGEESGRFAESWRRVQARFVDDPNGAVTEADRLVTEAMSTRGYPMADWDQRVADISVDHPHVVERYRAGHDIALRHARGDASTEDLRQAMVHYRELFNELIEPAHDASARAQQRRAG
jgi:hypothetical protein